MSKICVCVFAMFLSCISISDIVKANTKENSNPFEYEIVSEGEDTCRITGIRIRKDKGISVLEIPSTINGKTVISIGRGEELNKKDHTYYKWNTFFMQDDPDDEKMFWYSMMSSTYNPKQRQKKRAQKIKKIILPDTIKEIRDYAFAGLGGLKSVKLSPSLTTIGRCAFADTSISKMHIPAKLKEGVADLARSKASWKRFAVSKKNPYYKVKKNMLLSKDRKTLYAVLTPPKNICIPDSVKTVDEFAFYKASPQSVHLGAGVKEIKGGALSTKTRCRITLSPSNPYLARSGMCIYRKKKRELLVGIPKGRVFRISRKVKKLVADSISLVGIGKKYQVKKVYIPKTVETIEYGWGIGGYVHKNCRYYTERDYWTFQP